VLVDNAAPAVAVTAPTANSFVNAAAPSTYTVTATSSDGAGSGVLDVHLYVCSTSDCSSSTDLGADSTPPFQAAWSLPSDGSYWIKAVSHDDVGHASSDVAPVTVDRTLPNTAILTKPGNPTNAATPTFTFNGSDNLTATAGLGFECQLDGGTWNACSSPRSFAAPADGTHTWQVRAVDQAGNADSSPDSWTWLEDRTAPIASLADPAALNPAHAVAGAVTLSSTQSDPGGAAASGVNTVAYEYSADGITWASTPQVWNTHAITDGLYSVRVVVTDNAGNQTPSTPVASVKVDNTVPTTSQDDPGQYLRGTIALSGSAVDPQDPQHEPGSGVDRVEFQVVAEGGTGWTTIGTVTSLTGPYSFNFDTTAGTTPDGWYDFRTVATDRVGNVQGATPVTHRLVDNTVPTATMTDPGQNLRGIVALASTTDDPGGAVASGVATVTYEYAAQSDGVWHATPATWDTRSLTDGLYDVRVTAVDRAGNSTTSAAVSGRRIDNTPAVTTDDAPSGFQSSDVVVHLSATDSGSGVSNTQFAVDGAAYQTGTTVTIPAPADGSKDGTHTISYFSTDNAGNVEGARTATVKIDATPPVCPSCDSSAYVRNSITLSVNPSDGGAGIASVKFQQAPIGTDVSMDAGWSDVANGTLSGGTWSASWNTTSVADGGYAVRARAVDAAHNVGRINLGTRVVDNSAPTVSVGAPLQGTTVTGSTTIAATASDANALSYSFLVNGSQIASGASSSISWNTTSVGDGTVSIAIVATDQAGNSTTSATRTVTVDNNAPAPTLNDPGANVRGTVGLGVTTDGDTASVDYQRYDGATSTWITFATVPAPFTTSFDTTALADASYDVRVIAHDGSGHSGTSPTRTVRIDNTLPTGSLTDPPAGRTIGGQHAQLTATAADGGSGVATVEFQFRPVGGSTWTSIGSATGAPYQVAWNAQTVASGDYDVRLVVTDAAGNARQTAPTTVHVDSTAPTVTLADPGAALSGRTTLTADVQGPDAARVEFQVSPAGANSWTSIATDTSSPWSVPFDTAPLSDGLYDLRAVATDTVGNDGTSVVRAGIRIDNTAPTLLATEPVEGATVAAADKIVLTASELVTPTDVTVDGRPAIAPVVVGTRIEYATGTLAAGAHTVAGTLQDATGKSSSFQIHFTIWTPADGNTWTVQANTSATKATTVQAPNSSATITMPAGAWQPNGNNWVVLSMEPTSPTDLAAASSSLDGFDFGAGGGLDINANWALSASALHRFGEPLEIVWHTAVAGAIPATRPTGATWHLIPGLSGTTLPAGQDDGYFRVGADIHVLTRHLTQFALTRDVRAPTAPTGFGGTVDQGNLTLRWSPGTDNSGQIAGYALQADGQTIRYLGSDELFATVGAFDETDQRSFTISENDVAGNMSSPSRPLRVVPSLVGLTVEQARAVLLARGFTAGNVRETESAVAAAGTIVGPTGISLAEQGSAIDLTVAAAGGGAPATKLVLNVVGTKRFSWASRTFLGARVRVTRASAVKTTLVAPGGQRLYTWRLRVKAGDTIIKLPMPKQVRRAGKYTLVWVATAGNDTTRTAIPVQIVASGQGLGKVVNPSTTPVEVVLTGSRIPKDLALGLGDSRTRFVAAASTDSAFQTTGDPGRNVRVVVIDADQYGIGLVNDLRTVFPSVRLVVLSDDPRKLAAAAKSGAIGVPRSTTSDRLAKLVSKLALN
jgi:hypothetical protein